MKQIFHCLSFVTVLAWSVTAVSAGPNPYGPVSDSDGRIAGVVINEDDRPVADATIKSQGVSSGHGGQQWGEAGRFVDEPVVSDARGKFLLRCKPQVELIYAMISAPDAAPQPIQLEPGQDYVVRMHAGVRVTGQLLAAGRPVPGVSVRCKPITPSIGENFVSSPVVSDSNGCFCLPHLPADMSLILYTTMADSLGQGTLAPQTFFSGENHSSTNLGVLTLQPSFQVAGRILLSDGRPVPPRTRMLLVRQRVSDTAWFTLDSAGRFTFPFVPAETVSLGARLKGYKFSRLNPCLDPQNDYIVGEVNQDITNLTLVLEPGDFHFTPAAGGAQDNAEPLSRDHSLRGVSGSP